MPQNTFLSIMFNSHDVGVMDMTMRPLKTLFADRDRYPLTVPHRLDFYSMIYITRGDGHHVVDSKRYHYRAGSLFLVARHQIHHFVLNDHSEGYVITFTDNMLFRGSEDRLKPAVVSLFENVNHCSAPALLPIFDDLYREYQSEHPHREDLLHCIMRVLAHKILQNHATPVEVEAIVEHSLFDRFRQAIDQHFLEYRHVQDYATLLGCSPKKLCLLAKQQTGKSAKVLIDDRILLETKRMLAYSGLSIGELAVRLGFDEATNLAKFFRRHTGLSPSDFRSASRLNHQQNGRIYW
ncbi:AraC family transcriptional regulator [Parasalinivibrio latis]|uniref:AraC family transcriptional regulator n=1 Tax=Parasalinivibrio latis TaxID=2952610 RepID=UPI0030E2BD98